ncbi:MAG: nucleoside/nucleotide kinase family protein [Actinomycetaceae bacterium]
MIATDQLVDRAARLARPDGRRSQPAAHATAGTDGHTTSAARPILGLTGPPGAGKTTLATELADGLRARGITVAILPMDGFHLADVELTRLGRLHRKGALDTFDGWGYLSALERAAAATDHTVYVPGFERELEQPIAGAVAIEPDAELVITEGNYLLDEETPWNRLAGVLAETWFIDLADDVRQGRLVARHVAFGKAPDDAAAWVRDVDEPNARAIIARRHAADHVVALS